MKNIYKLIFVLSISFLFNACYISNVYLDNYKPIKQTDTVNSVFLKDNEDPVLIYSNTDNHSLICQMLDRGYKLLGYVNYFGTNNRTQNDSDIIAANYYHHARVITHSKKIVDSGEYHGIRTVETTHPYSGTISDYSGNYVDYSGTETTTSYVPYTSTYYVTNYKALFFVGDDSNRRDGFLFTPLSREENINIGHKGYVIDSILINSLAYNSNFLKGDILIQIDGQDIDNLNEILLNSLAFEADKMVHIFTVLRNNKTLFISLDYSKYHEVDLRELRALFETQYRNR